MRKLITTNAGRQIFTGNTGTIKTIIGFNILSCDLEEIKNGSSVVAKKLSC